MPAKILRQVAAAVVLSTLACSPLVAAAEQYSVEELPAVATRIGEMAMLHPLMINNRGQVLGSADVWDGSFTSDYWVAFRFDPDSGAKTVDPEDGLHSEAYALDQRGGVVGSTCGLHCRRDRIFRYTDQGGFDFLRTGSTGWIRRSFFPTSVTAAGDMAGYASRPSGRRTAVLYRRDAGWIDLAGLDSRLRPGPEGFFLNSAGEFVLATWSGVYAVHRKGVVTRIDPPGLEMTIAGMGEGGEVVGEVHTPAPWKGLPGPQRAFLYTPEGGFAEIHGGRFKRSVARWVTDDGVVGGSASRLRTGDTFFALGPGGRLRQWNLRRHLDRLHPGWKLVSAELVDMNARLQAIGIVRAQVPRAEVAAGGPRTKTIQFLFDPETGMVDLQDVVARANPELELMLEPVDLNDHGQVLLRARRSDGSWTGVVVTPSTL